MSLSTSFVKVKSASYPLLEEYKMSAADAVVVLDLDLRAASPVLDAEVQVGRPQL